MNVNTSCCSEGLIGPNAQSLSSSSAAMPLSLDKIKVLAKSVIGTKDPQTCIFYMTRLKLYVNEYNLSDEDLLRILQLIKFKAKKMAVFKSLYKDTDDLLEYRFSYPHKMPLSQLEAEKLLEKAPVKTWMLRWSTRQDKYIITEKKAEGQYNHVILLDTIDPNQVLKGLFVDYDIANLLMDYRTLEMNYSEGCLSKEEAEKMLQPKSPNAWIVRYSKNIEQYILSLKEEEGKYTHFNIVENHKEQGCYSFDQLLDNIEKIIEKRDRQLLKN